MLRVRILTAVFGIPLLGICLYYGGLLLQGLILAAVIVGLVEFSRLLGPKVQYEYLFAAGLSFVLLTYGELSDTKIAIWLFVQLFYFLVRNTVFAHKPFAAAENILGALYVAVPFSFMWLVRDHFGLWWSVYGLAITWATDTFAYFGGMRFGKTKLAPTISPNKSVEGAISGCVAGTVCGGGLALWLGQPLGFAVVVSFLLSIAGQLGDLSESALKREKSVKDTGSILPGHGGILDRCDSLAFVMPLLYIILTVINVPTGP
ncbi:MAG: hypothetical protein AA931_03150 [Peptococcaceae bacterium 1109]|nr:MAG: hypothetical protein AA931_03150 [Peptococcaceae bacterium 1109]